MTYRNKTPIQQLTTEKNKTFFSCVLMFLFASVFLGAILAALIYGEFKYREEGLVSPEKEPFLYWGTLVVLLLAGFALVWQGAVQVQSFQSISNQIRILKEYEKPPVAKSKTRRGPKDLVKRPSQRRKQ